MKLFLASEVKNGETIKKIEEYVGGFKGKKIAYIPTAANGEGWQSWRDGESWKLAQNLGAKISLVQLEDYVGKEKRLERDVIKELKGKNIIWFAGGFCGYLMYWIRRFEIDKHIKSILEEGTLYLGSSAGSIAAGPDLKVSEMYLGDNEYGAAAIPGMGLVDFTIYPHFRDELFEKIKKQYKGKRMYLLKDGEEIIVKDGRINFTGEKRIIENP